MGESWKLDSHSFVRFMRDARSEAGHRPDKSKFKGTPVHNALLTALGARIGHGARLQLSARASCQLLRVGAGCVVEESSVK
jgi:hypothetical protein